MVPETGQLDWEDFEKSVTGRTRLVAIGAASNALGTINDVTRAIGLARSVNAQVFVDAVHYVPHELADVRALDCDFLAMSAYKFYGPHIGVLYCKGELLDAIDFPKLIPAPDTGPERAETGTQNQEGMVGTGAAIDFLASLKKPGLVRGGSLVRPPPGRLRLQAAYGQLHERSAALVQQFYGLFSLRSKGFGFFVHADVLRGRRYFFSFGGLIQPDLRRGLAWRGLFLSHGDFYAATVIERLGLGPEGLVRAGCACYTTPEEIERLIEGVKEIAES